MVNSSRKGDRSERELVNALQDVGWSALRCPASGAATKEDRPDLLALTEARGLSIPTDEMPIARAYAIECKASKTGSVYLTHAEIEALCRYGLVAGAKPLVGVRPNRKPWSFFSPVEMNVNDKSRSVTQDMLPGRSFNEVFGDGI